MITTRNVTFDKQKFYNGNNDEELANDQLTTIIDMLYIGELVDPGEDLVVTLLVDGTANHELQLTTKQSLGGDLATILSSKEGLPTAKDCEQEGSARIEHEASVLLGIRVD